MISIYPKLTEATRTLQPILRTGKFLVVDAGISGWFHLYFAVEGLEEMDPDLAKVHRWVDLSDEIQGEIEKLSQPLSAVQQLAVTATSQLTHLGFRNMVVEVYVCDDTTWATFGRTDTAIGLAFTKTHGIGVLADRLSGEQGVDTLVHEWAHWYMYQMSKTEEARIKDWFVGHVQHQIDTKQPIDVSKLRPWVLKAISANFENRFNMPFDKFMQMADTIWDQQEDIADDGTISETLRTELGFTHWQNLAQAGVRIVGKFKKPVTIEAGGIARKGSWGYATGAGQYLIAATLPGNTRKSNVWCLNPDTGKDIFNADDVASVLDIDIEKSIQLYSKTNPRVANTTSSPAISLSSAISHIANYLQLDSRDSLADGLWNGKMIVVDSIFNDLLVLVRRGPTDSVFQLLPDGIQIWDSHISDIEHQLMKEGDTVDKITDIFTEYVKDCFTEGEKQSRARVVQTGVAPSEYGATNYREFFAVLIAQAARGQQLAPQMKQWLQDFIKGDFKESHTTKETEMSQSPISEALVFDKKVMRELSRKDSLLRMFAKDQPLDILFRTLVVGDSGLESKYIDIAKELGSDVGVSEGREAPPQKWEIGFHNLNEQSITRLKKQLHVQASTDKDAEATYITLPESEVPIPVSTMRIDPEHGSCSFRLHTVSERLARLVVEAMQKVLDGK